MLHATSFMVCNIATSVVSSQHEKRIHKTSENIVCNIEKQNNVTSLTLQHRETRNATSKKAICNTEAPNIYLLVFLLRLPPRFCYTSPSDRAPVAPPVGPPLARSGALHGAAGGSTPDPAAPLHEATGGGGRHRAARGEAEDNARRAG